jgi:hypothetical protein
MRVKSTLLALALTAALQPAIAGVVSLNFEDISIADNEDGYVELLGRYSSDGILFSGAAWGLVSSASNCGGVSKFITRDGGCSALALNAGDSFTLNFSQGFVAGSSLYYSALPGPDVKITLFEGENGTGKSTVIDGLTQAGCNGGARFCNWDLLNLDFSGVARSMVVTGADQTLMLDDFSFIQATPTNPGSLPEPGSIALAFSALGALGWARKRASR